MSIQKLSIIIPVFNEEKTVGLLLSRVKGTILDNDIDKEIIVINDCSKDQSEAEILKFKEEHPEQEIKYAAHKKNQGKGKAVQTGIKIATGDYIIIQDADLEYDPVEYNNLLKPVIDGHADVVYGSRFMGGYAHRVLFFWHSVGNKFLTTLSNMFTDLNLSDMETCYKLFPTHMVKKIKIREKRFGFEPEITAKLSKIKGARFYEVGISYHGRTYEEGKKIGWRDGFRAIYCILRYNLFG